MQPIIDPTASNGAPTLPRFRVFVPFDDATLEALEAAHVDIRKVRGETPPAKSWRPNETPEPPWEAVFRKPTPGDSDAFEGHVANERTKASALRLFAKAVVVAVSLDGKQTVCADARDSKAVRAVRDAWDALRAKYGGAHMAAQDDLMSLNGMARDEGGKD